jgi:hypothetical protein
MTRVATIECMLMCLVERVFCLLLDGRYLKYNSYHLLYIYFYFFAGTLVPEPRLINSLNRLHRGFTHYFIST